MVEPHKSSIGNLDANIVAFASYLASIVLSFVPVIKYVAWLIPLIFFLVEKKSSFVKFHAMQGFVLNVVGMIIGLIITIAGNIVMGIMMNNLYAAYQVAQVFYTVTLLIAIGIAVVNVLALVRAYKYEKYEIPIVCKISKKIDK